MCYRRARSERCCHHRGLDKLCFGGAGLARISCMDIDAVRALGGVSDGDRDQLLVLYRNRPIGDRCLVECPNAFITSGARLSIFFSLPRLFLLYIGLSQLRLDMLERSQQN